MTANKLSQNQVTWNYHLLFYLKVFSVANSTRIQLCPLLHMSSTAVTLRYLARSWAEVESSRWLSHMPGSLGAGAWGWCFTSDSELCKWQLQPPRDHGKSCYLPKDQDPNWCSVGLTELCWSKQWQAGLDSRVLRNRPHLLMGGVACDTSREEIKVAILRTATMEIKFYFF